MDQQEDVTMLRKTAVVLLAVILIVCCVPQAAVLAAPEFSDLQGHWARPYIEALAEKVIFPGVEGGSFRPKDKVTFEQFVALLLQSLDENPEPGATGGGAQPGAYMELALEKAIIEQSDMSGAGAVITRLEAVRVCAMTLTNLLLEEPEENATAAARDLKDFNSCKACRENISQLYAKGIVTGRPGYIFDGDAGLTKAEACAMIARTIDPSMRAATPPPDEAGVLISPESVKYIMETDENAILVDVRTQEEFETGHIPGAVCVPVGDLIESGAEMFPDKDAIIIVYCQRGSRSRQAYEFLRELGYVYVYDMGGIVDWPYELEP